MKKSDIFEPFVVVTNMQNTVGRPTYSHLLNFYKSCVDNVEIGWDENTKQGIDLKIFNPDIVFYQQPWDLFNNQNIDYVSKFALTYHFSYAMGEPLPCLRGHYNKFYSILYKYFVFSEKEANEYKKEMMDIGQNIAVTGHPKLDIYKDYKEENYEHKYVIYAPHHSFEEGSLEWATFQWNGKFILEWAKNHTEFDWIFKPHPQFKQALILNNIMTKDEVEEYYKAWENIGFCYEDGSYFDLFKNSKCLITDCGSFLIEYLPTHQPVIHLKNPKATDYIPSQRIAMQSYYQAWNIKDLNNYLEDLLIHNKDDKKKERLEVLKQLNIDTYNSTEKIIENIKQDILKKSI